MTTNIKRLFAVTFAGVVVTAGCGGGEKAPAVVPPNSTAPATISAVSVGDFGVPECDQYMKKYVACIDGKVPEMARASFRQSLDQTKEAWKKIAATPEGRAGLANACTQAETQTKAAMQAYGCSW